MDCARNQLVPCPPTALGQPASMHAQLARAEAAARRHAFSSGCGRAHRIRSTVISSLELDVGKRPVRTSGLPRERRINNGR